MPSKQEKIPASWTHGTIVYIYKNKGGPWKCGNYRTISLTQIIYKIWTGLITRKLPKITHILTISNQFGFKEGISTSDAIIKVEQYIENANRNAKILLMGLSKAFGATNRTLLWTTIYKRNTNWHDQTHTRHEKPRHKTSTKYKCKYGTPSGNNIGVSQGSAISAILFIIYMGDMMEDNAALRRRSNPPFQNSSRQTRAARTTTPLGDDISRRQT